MNTNVVIVWYENKPVGIWCGDAVIWETEEIIPETNLLSTTVALPFTEAVSLLTILVNGIAVNNLMVILKAITIKVAELKALETDAVNDVLDDNYYDGFDDYEDCDQFDDFDESV